jgi:DNA ligase-1
MVTVFSTPILESVGSKGLKKFWQGRTLQDDLWNAYTQATSWQEVKDGGTSKPVVSAPSLVKAKNVGKTNETNVFDQAMAEIIATMKTKMDKGYHEEGVERNIRPLPMLCLKLQDAKHRLTGGLVVQPKLDGMRGIYDGTVMWSRSGKDLLPEIYAHLQIDTQGYMLDGELIMPMDKYTFQDTMKMCKKFRPELTPLLEYHVFDIVDPTGKMDYATRHMLLSGIIYDNKNPKIKQVATYNVRDLDEAMKYQERFVTQGYEGLIIRMLEGKYKSGDTGKSHEIQKFKYFFDDEYKVVDIEDGRGKNDGLAKFVCETSTGSVFRVDFNGTEEVRREMFENRDKYIGQMLTVKYQCFTDDGVTPKFGKGISFRDYDLQGGNEDI